MQATLAKKILRDATHSDIVQGRFIQALQFLFILLPVLITFLYIRTFAVEIPMWDDWDLFIPHFHHLAAGQLQWSDINSQHNESLVAFPLLVALSLAKLTGGQLLAEAYLSYLFLCGCLFFLFRFFRLLRLPGRWSVMWFLPVSVLFLGWRQSEGLLWSAHLVNSMSLFFFLAALYCCTQAYRVPIFFPTAILCAVIASFSMASGLLVWLFGAIYFAVVRPKDAPAERVIRRFVGWVVLGAVCSACFFLDYTPHLVPWPTGIAYVLANLRAAGEYALIYLGSSLSRSPQQALYAGIAFLLIALPSLFVALKKAREVDGLIPVLLLIGYVGTALGSILMGRLGLGVEQGFASRYVTLEALAPISVYFCLLALAHKITACRYLAGAMAALLVVGIFNSYGLGLEDGRKERARRTDCANAVKDFRHQDRNRFSCAYPDPGVVLERAPWLEKDHLSLFHE
jgi:hypothetical protein